MLHLSDYFLDEEQPFQFRPILRAILKRASFLIHEAHFEILTCQMHSSSFLHLPWDKDQISINTASSTDILENLL